MKTIKKEILKKVVNKHRYDALGHVRFHIPNDEIRAMENEVTERLQLIKNFDVDLIKRKGKCELFDKHKMIITYENATYKFDIDTKKVYVMYDDDQDVYVYDITPIGKLIGKIQSKDIKHEENENN